MESLEKLSLILVQSLNLHVKERVGVNNNSVVLLNILGKILLVVQLNLGELIPERLIIRKGSELFKLSVVLNPTVAYSLADQVRELGVSLIEPSSEGNAVGHVLELVGINAIVILEGLLFKDFGVESGNAVYAVAGG